MEAVDAVSFFTHFGPTYANGRKCPLRRSRSPVVHVPWWVLIWINRSPLFFLVVSITCFSVGLVLFAFSSNQVSIVFRGFTIYTPLRSLIRRAAASCHSCTYNCILIMQHPGHYRGIRMDCSREMDLCEVLWRQVGRQGSKRCEDLAHL